MGVLFSQDGRYHGHCNVDQLAESEIVRKNTKPGYYRFCTDEQWDAVKSSDGRAKACESLGYSVASNGTPGL